MQYLEIKMDYYQTYDAKVTQLSSISIIQIISLIFIFVYTVLYLLF